MIVDLCWDKEPFVFDAVTNKGSIVFDNVAGTCAIAVAGMAFLFLADEPDKTPLSSKQNKTG